MAAQCRQGQSQFIQGYSCGRGKSQRFGWSPDFKLPRPSEIHYSFILNSPVASCRVPPLRHSSRLKRYEKLEVSDLIHDSTWPDKQPWSCLEKSWPEMRREEIVRVSPQRQTVCSKLSWTWFIRIVLSRATSSSQAQFLDAVPTWTHSGQRHASSGQVNIVNVWLSTVTTVTNRNVYVLIVMSRSLDLVRHIAIGCHWIPGRSILFDKTGGFFPPFSTFITFSFGYRKSLFSRSRLFRTSWAMSSWPGDLTWKCLLQCQVTWTLPLGPFIRQHTVERRLPSCPDSLSSDLDFMEGIWSQEFAHIPQSRWRNMLIKSQILVDRPPRVQRWNCRKRIPEVLQVAFFATWPSKDMIFIWKWLSQFHIFFGM